MLSVTPSECRYEIEKRRYKIFLDQNTIRRSGDDEAIRTAPLFSLAVKYKVDQKNVEGRTTISREEEDGSFEIPPSIHTKETVNSENEAPDAQDTTEDDPSMQPESLFPQYGLLGFSIRDDDGIGHHEPIMFNMHAPNSVFICGSQGSGKSYTLACLLENCLIRDPRFGQVQQPVAGLAFN